MNYIEAWYNSKRRNARAGHRTSAAALAAHQACGQGTLSRATVDPSKNLTCAYTSNTRVFDTSFDYKTDRPGPQGLLHTPSWRCLGGCWTVASAAATLSLHMLLRERLRVLPQGCFSVAGGTSTHRPGCRRWSRRLCATACGATSHCGRRRAVATLLHGRSPGASGPASASRYPRGDQLYERDHQE